MKELSQRAAIIVMWNINLALAVIVVVVVLAFWIGS